MVYRKNFKRRFRRRFQRKGRRLNKRQARQVKNIIGRRQEHKYYDSYTDAQPLTTTPLIYQISTIAQGDTDISRDGDRLMLSSVHVRGNIEYDLGTPFTYVRLIFFQWKPLSNALQTDILAPGANTVNIDETSHYNWDRRQLFRILWDRTFVLIGNGTQDTSNGENNPLTTKSVYSFNRRLYPKLKQLQYSAGGTTGTNQIWYLAYSTYSGSNTPQITMTCRHTFTDS